jgi:broad specificity phosphatase PhoE
MKKIIFMTSGKIKYLLPGISLYGSIASVARGETYPHLDSAGITEVENVSKLISPKINSIFYAPSFQCAETASFFSGPSKSLDLLLPLKFDLRKIVKKQEFEMLGIKSFDTLRQRYLRAFFEDKLLESNREIVNRFNRLVDMCLSNTTTLVISHAYLVKQFYAYYLIGENMFVDYKKLLKIFRPKSETMSRLETVKIIIN